MKSKLVSGSTVSEEDAAEVPLETPHIHVCPKLMVSHQTHVEVGNSENVFVIRAAQLFCEVDLDSSNYNSGLMRTGELHSMHKETPERLNR